MNTHTNLAPNPGKKIEIEVDDKIFSRYPIKTELFQKGDDYAEKIASIVNDNVSLVNLSFLRRQESRDPSLRWDDTERKWYVIISEKIVAISQGRSYFIKDIKPSWWATTLSKYVKRTPHGIGLGSPWTMQLAIGEVGLPRILLASLLSVITKPLGLQGVFYHIAGRRAASIDGPTSYSLYPSNVSAKLAPKDPQGAALKIKAMINEKLKMKNEKFDGVVIIDANDLGRNVLGNATNKPNSFFEEVMRDNPMGQGSEQTPIVIVV